MTEQSERQRRETEQMEIVIEHMEMVGNRQECHGKAGERWRRSEKIRYMTQPGIGNVQTRNQEMVEMACVHKTCS